MNGMGLFTDLRSDELERQLEEQAVVMADAESRCLGLERASHALKDLRTKSAALMQKYDELKSERRKQSQSSAVIGDGRSAGKIEEAQQQRFQKKEELLVLKVTVRLVI